jgi:transposase
MKNFWLTDDELKALRLAHRTERNRSSAYKINAVILLGTGWKLKAVKEALLLDEETLRSYILKYKTLGIDGLIETHHQGRVSFLCEEQQTQLCEALEHTIYLTTQEVVDYVKRECAVDYSVSGMRNLLHRLGYEYKKPKLVPGNPDREEQEQFVAYYERFMEEKPANEEVLFIDAVHPEHNTMAAYGWIKRGQKRYLKTNSGRQRLNLHGAINIETMGVTIIESKVVNADSTIELLETLNQKYPLSSRLHIILDNARYHYSKVVKDYLKDNSRINLVFLPAYSPELNLIERLWRFFKKSVLHNHYYANMTQFRAACISFFQSIGQHKEKLIGLLGGGFEGFSQT